MQRCIESGWRKSSLWIGSSAQSLSSELFYRCPTRRLHAPNTQHFHLCVIGGGPAGITAAIRAASVYRKSVCLVEQARIGGADVWGGTLQGKMLWQMGSAFSKLSKSIATRVFGEKFKASSFGTGFDIAKAHQKLQLAAETRENQLRSALSVSNIKIFWGRGTFWSPHEVQVYNPEKGSICRIHADYFIIATGSIPNTHPHFITDQGCIVNSDVFFDRLTLPESLVVVGAGPQGCELASLVAMLGKTKVTVIDHASRILHGEDLDIATVAQNELERYGIRFYHSSTLMDMRCLPCCEPLAGGRKPHRLQYTIQNRSTSEVTTLTADVAMMAIGRRPNHEGLGLSTISVSLDSQYARTDENGGCLPHQNIFMAGDVTRGGGTVNRAKLMGTMVVDRIFGRGLYEENVKSALKYASHVYFMAYAITGVGLNEIQCQKRGIAYIVGRYGFKYVERALAMGTTEGFVKILVTCDAQKRVLGAQAIGPQATVMVEIASLAIQRQMTALQLSELLTAHPTITQAFVECLRIILGTSILKPGSFPSLLKREWEPEL